MTEPLEIDEKDLVDTRIAARMLGISPVTLNVMRRQGRGPAYYKIGNKTVRYAISDLTSFAERHDP